MGFVDSRSIIFNVGLMDAMCIQRCIIIFLIIYQVFLKKNKLKYNLFSIDNTYFMFQNELNT